MMDLISGLGPTLYALLAAAIGGLLWLVRRSGVKSAKDKRTAERLDAIKNKQKVEKNAQDKSDADLIAGITRK